MQPDADTRAGSSNTGLWLQWSPSSLLQLINTWVPFSNSVPEISPMRLYRRCLVLNEGEVKWCTALRKHKGGEGGCLFGGHSHARIHTFLPLLRCSRCTVAQV